MDKEAIKLKLLEILYQAAAEEYGLTVRVTSGSLERFRQLAYAVRKDRPELSRLSFRLDPVDPQLIWIENKGNETATAEAHA